MEQEPLIQFRTVPGKHERLEPEHVDPLERPKRRRKNLVQRLHALRWLLAGIAVLAFLLTFFVRQDELAGSTITFLVEGNEPRPAEEVGRYYRNTSQVRVFHMATSSAMLEHLVQTFSLGKHYGMDDPDRIQPAMDLLLDRMEVHMIDEMSQSITIRDKDPVLAERMVTEAFVKLGAMLDEQRTMLLERNAAINKRLLAATEVQAAEHMNAVYTMLSELRSAERGQAGPQDGSGAEDPDRNIDQLLASLAATRSALFDLRMDVERASIILDEKLPPTVEVLRNASLDHGSPLWRALAPALGWSAIALVVSVGAIVLWHFHWNDLRQMLTEQGT